MLHVAKRTEPAPIVQAAAGISSSWLEFASHLARKYSIVGDLLSGPRQDGRQKRLRDLWEITDLSANEFADEVARFYRLSRLGLPQLLAANSLTNQFSHRFLREAAVFPCRLNNTVGNTLAVADPTDETAIRAVELALGEPSVVVVSSFEDIGTVLAERIGEEQAAPLEAKDVISTELNEDVESLRDLASGAPVVRAVNDLLEKALEFRATDIHIEPFRNGLVLRMRVDGLLRLVPIPADVLPQALISRVKILAGLNIAERRMPQDGAAHLRVARSVVDIRVATMPTQHGESAVIRLLPKDKGILDMSRLGLCSADQQTLDRLLNLPHGILIVTGPTGSGKTTTLATMLTALNDTTRKILTIEDPIEYELRGINQSQVKPEIGLTFAAALRAFVRQDPDVIMVGEVRDTDTTQVAIHAALTGHLVLTTLHTESAAAAIPRLVDLGAERFLLQSTIRAIIAQRLVRILCERCKHPRLLTAESVANDPRYQILGLQTGETVHEPTGCEHCNGTGYRGRTGIFEVLEVTEEMRALLGSEIDAATITKTAVASGMTTMFRDGISKCRSGVTSAAEVLRVSTAR